MLYYPEAVGSSEEKLFYGCHIRKEVILPATLTEIQAGAFAENCTLPQVRFPASVQKLGAQCYKGCNNLKAVRFESGSRRCRKGSRVEAYCEENGLKTEYIDER